MKNILLFIIFVLFTTGCSNIRTQKTVVSDRDKQSLFILINDIKTDLRDGKLDILNSALASNVKNSMIKKELKEIDFSRINIMTSKPIFDGNKAKNVVGLVLGSTAVYFDVEYLLKNGKWKILNFKERRGLDET